MKITPLECPRCGAVIKNEKNEGMIICEYCGTRFVIDGSNDKTNITASIPLTGNTIYIVQQPQQIAPEILDHYYKVYISREKRFNGCAIYCELMVNNKIYKLTNGGEVSFETNLKNPCFSMDERSSLVESVSIPAQLSFSADGRDVEICLAIDPRKFGNMFHLKVLKSNNRTVKIS